MQLELIEVLLLMIFLKRFLSYRCTDSFHAVPFLDLLKASSRELASYTDSISFIELHLVSSTN